MVTATPMIWYGQPGCGVPRFRTYSPRCVRWDMTAQLRAFIWPQVKRIGLWQFTVFDWFLSARWFEEFGSG